MSIMCHCVNGDYHSLIMYRYHYLTSLVLVTGHHPFVNHFRLLYISPNGAFGAHGLTSRNYLWCTDQTRISPNTLPSSSQLLLSSSCLQKLLLICHTHITQTNMCLLSLHTSFSIRLARRPISIRILSHSVVVHILHTAQYLLSIFVMHEVKGKPRKY